MSIIIIIFLCILSFVLGANYKKIILKLKSKNHQKKTDTSIEEKSYDFDTADLKMVFLVRDDLKMGAGKIAAQVAHAAVGLFDDITSGDDDYHQQALDFWNEFGAKKVVLRGENLNTLSEAASACKKAKIPYIMISDAGHTQVPAGSVTVLGIGPDSSEKINAITGKFKLMR